MGSAALVSQKGRSFLKQLDFSGAAGSLQMRTQGYAVKGYRHFASWYGEDGSGHVWAGFLENLSPSQTPK